MTFNVGIITNDWWGFNWDEHLAKGEQITFDEKNSKYTVLQVALKEYRRGDKTSSAKRINKLLEVNGNLIGHADLQNLAEEIMSDEKLKSRLKIPDKVKNNMMQFGVHEYIKRRFHEDLII